MKWFLTIILTISLSVGTVPLAAFAAVDPKSQDFQNYLTEIDMIESEFLTYLEEEHSASLNDFDNLEDLKFILGPLVNDQNLQELLNELELKDTGTVRSHYKDSDESKDGRVQRKI